MHMKIKTMIWIFDLQHKGTFAHVFSKVFCIQIISLNDKSVEQIQSSYTNCGIALVIFDSQQVNTFFVMMYFPPDSDVYYWRATLCNVIVLIELS